MNAIQRKLAVEVFCEYSSIHGVAYLNTKKRVTKVTWGLIVLASTLLIVLGTILLVQQYLNYNDYIITKEYDLDKLEEVPNVLVCSSDELSMVDSVARLNLSLNTPVSSISTFDNGVIELVECEISTRETLIDCMKFKRRIIFTFNGFCLFVDLQELKQNESLLFKQFDQFSYFETYRPTIKMKLKADYELLYYKLLSSIAPPRYLLESHSIINSKQNSRAKHYDITLQQDSFSSSLKNKKCFQKTKKYLDSQSGYDEYSCEFECLQRLVKHTLNCHLDFSNSKDSTDCTVRQLIKIEEIVKNYTSSKIEFKQCKKCLPNCETFKFNSDEARYRDDEEDAYGLSLNLHLTFKKSLRTRILNFEESELLNFVNGLWSLFLGISVLSIWEIFEFLYSLRKKNVVINRANYGFEGSRIFQITKSCLFIDSHFHGTNFIFMCKGSKSFKIRWIAVIALATLGFAFATANAISNYQQYLSDTRREIVSIKSDEDYSGRNITFLVCKPFDPVNASDYNRLDDIAARLFLSNISLDQSDLVSSYRKRLSEMNISVIKMDTYETAFEKYDFGLDLWALPQGNPVLMKTVTVEDNYFHYDKECAWFENIFKANDLLQGQSYAVNLINKKIQFFQIFILDSKSLHLLASSKTEGGQLFAIPRGTAIPKHQKLLSDPYKPSCVKKEDYKQHECYQDCFNDLIESKFKCRVLFGMSNNSLAKYCEPWLIPLIKNYEKHVLKNSYTDVCLHCKEPCEFYFYELENDYSLQPNILIFGLSPSLERIEQFVVIPFEDTLTIIVSYVSLFFGGSLLAIIQLLYNFLSTTSFINRLSKFEFSCLRKLEIMDLFSKFNTIHCARYLSTKHKNDLKKLFWVFMITLALASCISVSVLEFSKYKKSVSISQISVSENEQNSRPKIHICRNVVNDPMSLLKLIIYDLSDLNPFNSLNKVLLSDLEIDINANNAAWSYEHLVQKLFEGYHSSKSAEEMIFELLESTKWSSLIQEQEKSFFDSIETQNGVVFDEELEIYQTSLLYSDYLNTDLCRTLSISLVEDIERNPFIRTKANAISMLFKEDKEYGMNYYFDEYDIYLNNFVLHMRYLRWTRETGVNDIKRVKSILLNYDYQRGCKNKKAKCIFNQKMLQQYSDHELFLCDDRLKEVVYKVFNCTPFVNTTTRVPECSIAYTALIHGIMFQFRKDLNKCEISTALHPIHFESISMPLQNESEIYSTSVDLNVVELYAQNMKEEYDLFKLLTNVSNLLNVLIGFSFITICELVLIFFHFYCSSFHKVIGCFQ